MIIKTVYTRTKKGSYIVDRPLTLTKKEYTFL